MKKNKQELKTELKPPYKLEILPGKLIRLEDGGLMVVEPTVKPVGLKCILDLPYDEETDRMDEEES